MSGEIDRLRDALAGTRTPARPAAKAAALEAALAAFDQAASQGTAGATRQRDRRLRPGSLVRRWLMTLTFPSLKTAAFGTVSLAALSIAVLLADDLRDETVSDLAPPLAQDEAEEHVPAPPAPQVAADVAPADAVAAARLGGGAAAEMERDAARSSIQRTAPPPPADRQLKLSPRRSSPPSPSEAELQPPVDRLAAETRPAPARFPTVAPNPVQVTAEAPVSTFSVDVDTASYAYVRGRLLAGHLPVPDAIRVEEMINYFAYDYAPPSGPETPFRTHLALIPTPWNPETRLLRIGIKGYEIPADDRPRANLTFLIDTSGSMAAPEKLPLLRNALRLMLGALRADDTVAIVTYAGTAGVLLDPTPVSDRSRILTALEGLSASGSTAGSDGLRLAYRLAGARLEPETLSRVILATDGDFNVGLQDPANLTRFIAEKRETGISLSVLGFGREGYDDAVMQALAQNGNGQAFHIDTLGEARRALVDGITGTLQTIAGDVKIQVEFNPAAIAEYRLIGYETRHLDRAAFNNDAVDAAEIGAGHSVTALYEIVPVGSAGRKTDPLRYSSPTAASAALDEYALLRIRYKLPGDAKSRLIETPIAADTGPDPAARFAAAVAAFGQLLAGVPELGEFGYPDLIDLANGLRAPDPAGARAEFLTLVRLAAALSDTP